MGDRPWADLTSAERLNAILRAVGSLERGEASAARVAMVIERDHSMVLPRYGKNGHSNGLRRPNMAVRVTPGIIALRRRGLLTDVARADGRSGSADALTADGEAYVERLR